MEHFHNDHENHGPDFEDFELMDSVHPDDVRAEFARFKMVISPEDAWGATAISLTLRTFMCRSVIGVQ